MANSSQILSLITSHLGGDDAHFREIALQLAAVEAKAGHMVLSRAITDALKSKNTVRLIPRSSLSLNGELAEYVVEIRNGYRLQNIVCSEEVRDKINRIITEYAKRELLYNNGLTNRSKILLAGPSGTGKTMTASILANELFMPLYVVRLDKIITKFMGETSFKLGKIFDVISSARGVYLFDEFDALGAQRSSANDVGEMRRVLTTFLQLLERENSDSLVIAATNCAEVLDSALFRRFDDIITYDIPDERQRVTLIQRLLQSHCGSDFDFSSAAALLQGHSHADITMACKDTLKESLLNDIPLDFTLFKSSAMRRFTSYQQQA